MSNMWSLAREIAAGDVVIVWLTRDIIQPLLITPGKDFNSKFGAYRHSDLVGIPYGSKVGSRNGKGFIHVLRPTPELWTMALPHRTQILYLADIAFITSWLNITRGSRVIEAGTGSGSFSHSVVRSIGSTGHLWSYEFHEARVNKAREEFARHGMSDVVTLTHRNVCKDGFTVVDTVDSVFLDLPAPWDAVDHAKKALRKDRISRICCFSPCMEQVLRTVSALNEAGFTEVTMYETLQRPHDVSPIPALPKVSEIGAKLKKSELKREQKRLKQIASARAKRKREEEEGEGEEVPIDADGEMDVDVADSGVEVGSKRFKPDSDVGGTIELHAQNDGPQPEPAAAVAAAAAPSQESLSVPVLPDSLTGTPSASPPTGKIIVSKPMAEVRGHTSYLTFACLIPTTTKMGKEDDGADADVTKD